MTLTTSEGRCASRTTPVALDDSRLRQLLPDLKKTSYEDGIQKTIASMGGKTAAAKV